MTISPPIKLAWFATARTILQSIPQWPQVLNWADEGLVRLAYQGNGRVRVELTEDGVAVAVAERT